mgnify:CR=1 FL=1
MALATSISSKKVYMDLEYMKIVYDIYHVVKNLKRIIQKINAAVTNEGLSMLGERLSLNYKILYVARYSTNNNGIK